MNESTQSSDFRALFEATDPRLRWFNPCSITLRTLSHAGDQTQTKQSVLKLLEALAPDPSHKFLADWYRHGLDSFGHEWRYLDALCILAAYSRLARPRTYLEIGVRNGKSLCIVGATQPHIALFGFDLFPSSYAAQPSLNPEQVANEVARLGHKGTVQLFKGNSRDSIPAFLEENPEVSFDLIYVDGDHSEEGARIDLANVVNRLSYGGLLVFDDICNPMTRHLLAVWRTFLAEHKGLQGVEFLDGGNGVAFALRTRVFA